MPEPLLRVEDLCVSFPTPDGLVRAVDRVSFDLNAGERLGVVGESGSGKSVTFLTIMGLTERGRARITGRAVFEGEDLISMSDHDLRAIRGRRMSMVFQDPMSSLHPFFRVGDQISEAVLAHEPVSKQAAAARAVDLLKRVGIPKPEERARQYPHEFSGGMRQRAMIAMALSMSPALLIADEPTTALDVTVQAQILELIDQLRAEEGAAVVLITHDLGVVAAHTDTVQVMYAGRLVERASRDEIFVHPKHPYTWGLLESIPRLDRPHERLRPIPGAPPSLIHVPKGCPFHPRCPHRFEPCDREEPILSEGFHREACHLDATAQERLWTLRETTA